MPATEILLLRHGHRIAWILDPTTGQYTSNHPFPTRLPADPPLASHGVDQAVVTGKYLAQQLGPLAAQDRLRVYSSMFYRCFQTLQPFVEEARKDISPNLRVRGERGVGEWFGRAWFDQPIPAELSHLRSFYSWIDDEYTSKVIPNRRGESIEALHARIGQALSAIIVEVEREYEAEGRSEEEITILICGHAAQIIASGRELTGDYPDDPDTDDFKCFTCGISKFVRKKRDSTSANKGSNNPMGQWECVLNSDCSHLPNGEERGWHFHGDESFDSYESSQNRGPIIANGGVKSGSVGKL